MRRIIICLALLVSATMAQQTYWVNASCSLGTGCNGTSATAGFRTLPEARNAVRTYIAGTIPTGNVTVNIKAGTYRLSSQLDFLSQDGMRAGNGNWVVYQAVSGETVIVTGGVQVASSGWTQNSQKPYIWEKTVTTPDFFRQLWVNGKRAQRARTDGTYLSPVTQWHNNVPSKNTGEPGDNYTYVSGDGVFVPIDSFPVGRHAQSDISDLEVVWSAEWRNYRHLVRPNGGPILENGRHHFLLDMTYFDRALSKRPEVLSYVNKSTGANQNYPFFVENSWEDITQPGEWYFRGSNNRLSYYPLPGQDPNTTSTTFHAGNITTLFRIVGSSASPVRNLRFSGIRFMHAGWLGPNRPLAGEPGFLPTETRWGGFATIQAEKIVRTLGEQEATGGILLPAAVTAEYVQGLEFLNNRFENMGTTALSIIRGVTNTNIRGNYIRDVSGAGITLGHWDHTWVNPGDVCSNVEIANNLIVEPGAEFFGSCGITVYNAQNSRILNNTLYKLPYTGISNGWTWSNTQINHGRMTISRNYINDFNRLQQDGGGIYNLGNNSDVGTGGITLMERNFIRNDRNRPSQTTVPFQGAPPFYSFAGGSLYFDAGSSNITARFNVIQGSPKTFQMTPPADPTARADRIILQGTFSTTELNNIDGTNLTIDPTLVATGGYWQGHPEAWTTVTQAGVQPAFASLLNNLSAEERQELGHSPLVNLPIVIHPTLF